MSHNLGKKIEGWGRREEIKRLILLKEEDYFFQNVKTDYSLHN